MLSSQTVIQVCSWLVLKRANCSPFPDISTEIQCLLSGANLENCNFLHQTSTSAPGDRNCSPVGDRRTQWHLNFLKKKKKTTLGESWIKPNRPEALEFLPPSCGGMVWRATWLLCLSFFSCNAELVNHPEKLQASKGGSVCMGVPAAPLSNCGLFTDWGPFS